MSDTIAAVATGAGASAIGMIRLSGPRAVEAADAVFSPRRGASLRDRPDRQLVYGILCDKEGAPIDQVLATITRGPGSYTGEDTAELQCHGSPTVLAMGMEALFAHGVRQALAGEFTKRAFLNGRMDLTQAEAVVDLIDAGTAEAARHAAGQLTGALGRRVEYIYNTLVDMMAHFHAVLDYPDEDIEPFEAKALADSLQAAEGELTALLATYDRGKLITGGVPCAIVGSPNVGKSSLLNALLGYDRAIVTPIAGTTRDTIEERVELGGTLLRLIDTAGLRESEDEIERLGTQRSREALCAAQLVFFVVDGTRPLTEEDRAILDLVQRRAPRALCVVNKADKPPAVKIEELKATFPHLCMVSALTGAGLELLDEEVAALFPKDERGAYGEMLTNARQAEAAHRALVSIGHAADSLRAGMTPDAVLVDVEGALSALGELTGKTVREDITGRIFQRFCVGK